MFTAISAILGAIGSVIASIIKVIPWQAWACLAIFLFGGWMFYGGSCHEFACGPSRKDTRDIKWDELTVISTPTGASLECKVGNRGKRTKTVSLTYIIAPSNGALAEESRASLERLSGSLIRIPYQGIIRKDPVVKSTPTVSEAAVDLSTEPAEEQIVEGSIPTESGPLEARIIVGMIYNSYGQCLNTEQVRLGMAELSPDAPKSWKAFETEAKKKKLGVWKSKK
jgi:hypothetical protein